MKAITVRLADETYGGLEEEAERLGLAPAVLARAYIKGSLDAGVDLMITPTLPEELRVTTTATNSGDKSNRRKRKSKGRR